MASGGLRLVGGRDADVNAHRSTVDRDTVRCLRALLADAEAGKIIGISYAVMAADREFFYNSCGEAHRNPAWAAALSATLMHGTMKRIFGEDV